jgi:hypothetical protein
MTNGKRGKRGQERVKELAGGWSTVNGRVDFDFVFTSGVA